MTCTLGTHSFLVKELCKLCWRRKSAVALNRDQFFCRRHWICCDKFSPKQPVYPLCLHIHWARIVMNRTSPYFIAFWTKEFLRLVIVNHEWSNSYTDSILQICSTSCSFVQRAVSKQLHWLWRIRRTASSPKHLRQCALWVDLWFNWVFWKPKKSCRSHEKTAEVSLYDTVPKVQASRAKTLETFVSTPQVDHGYCPGKQANQAKYPYLA